MGKRTAILLGQVLLGGVSPLCAAEDGATVYGVLQAAYEHYHLSAADGSSAASNAAGSSSRTPTYGSFIGFRGKETLGNGMSTLFQVESYVFMNGRQPQGFNPLGSRNTRVGLESQRYGTVFLGIWDTPFRDLLARVPFVGTTLDPGPLIANGVGNSVANREAPASFARRQTNTIAYWSPDMRGFQARMHYATNDASAGGNGAHLLSVRGSYPGGPATFMAAYETHHGYGGGGTTDRGLALYGDLAIGQAKLGAIFTNLSYQRPTEGGMGSLRTNNWTLFGTYRLGSGALHAAYTRSGKGSGSLKGLTTTASGQVSVDPASYVGQVTSGSNTGAHTFELGYDHFLSKRTKLFANVMYLRNDAHGAYMPFGGVPPAPGALGVKATVLAIGMQTSF